MLVPAEFLDRMMDRLDRMEQRLEQLVQAAPSPARQRQLEAAERSLAVAAAMPSTAAMVGDMIDGWIQRASDRGIDVDARLQAGLQAMEALTEPHRLEALSRLSEQLPQLEALAKQLDALPGLLATAADVVDGWIRRAQNDGVDLDATLQAILPTLRVIADPKVVGALTTLAEKAPELADVVDQGPQMLAAAVDSLDGVMGRLVTQGVDIQKTAENAAVALSKFAALLNSPQYQALMNSGVLDPSALEMVGKAGSALVHARMEACVETGMFGALRATGDKDVQRALGFAIKFAQTFGQELALPDNLKHLAAQGNQPPPSATP